MFLFFEVKKMKMNTNLRTKQAVEMMTMDKENRAMNCKRKLKKVVLNQNYNRFF